MARFGCWKNGIITLASGSNSWNFSDHAREIALDTSVAELPDDTHGDDVAKVCAGLLDWTITATFQQDFATDKIDQVFNVIGYGGHEPFSIEVGPINAACTTTNPRYSGLAILASYKVLGGAHGANLESQCTFRPASRLTRRTS